MELLIKNIRACDPQTGLDGITDIGIDGGKIVSLGKLTSMLRELSTQRASFVHCLGFSICTFTFVTQVLPTRRTSSQVLTPQRLAVSRASLVCRTQSRLSTPLRA